LNEASQPSPRLVRDLMTVGVQTCAPDLPVIELVNWFLDLEIEAAVVMAEGHALGMVSRHDLVRAYAAGDYAALNAEDVMTESVPQVPPEIPLTAAAQIMQDLGVRVLFLMHHAAGIEYPAAVITYRHLLRHMAASDQDQLSDLGILAERQTPVEAFNRRRAEALKRRKGKL
jgi:predicted transcriptional regulator